MTHTEALELLPLFLGGKLSTPKHDELKKMLQSSLELREELSFLRLEREAIQEYFGLQEYIAQGHLHPDLIARHAEGELTINSERLQVERHIAECSDCRNEYDIVSKISKTGREHERELVIRITQLIVSNIAPSEMVFFNHFVNRYFDNPQTRPSPFLRAENKQAAFGDSAEDLIQTLLVLSVVEDVVASSTTKDLESITQGTSKLLLGPLVDVFLRHLYEKTRGQSKGILLKVKEFESYLYSLRT